VERVEIIVTPGQLRRLMRKRKLSGAALARLAGTSQPTISRLASGTTSSCRGGVGPRIERVLGVDPGTLFAERQSPSTPEVAEDSSGGVAVPAVSTAPRKSSTQEAAA
jgi:transcriptional regulator with XRE-family HTH domain